MNIEQFKKTHSLKSHGLRIFESEEAKEYSIIDSIVTEQEINEIEKEIECQLPQNYKEFCKNFGGGDFGLVLILSLDKLGEFYLLQTYFQEYFPKDFIPFSDDQTGGFYSFKKVNGISNDEAIYYVDANTGSVILTDYFDFFDFIIKNAYES